MIRCNTNLVDLDTEKKLGKISNKTAFLSFMIMNTHLTVSTLTEDSIAKIIEQVIQRQIFEVTKEHVEESPDPFITRKEAIKILGITLPTLRAWTVAGKIPSYRMSSRVRYKRSEVIAYVESGRIRHV